MTGSDFIEFARKLGEQYADDPAAIRSVVSRLYYGVFHIAKKHLEDLGFHATKTERSHIFVQTRFQNANEEHPSEFGDLLVQLHERRKLADYRLDVQRYETTIFREEAVIRVEKAMAALGKCAHEPTRTKIKEGIVSYHRKINYVA